MAPPAPLDWPDRLLLALAALAGFLGVVLSAAAAHLQASPSLATAAQFLLFHATALIGLVALAASGRLHRGAVRASGYALVLGLALFSGDLATRALAQMPLLPMAAPTGGVLLMLGWVLAGLAAALPRR
ncbi:MAG: DUF423 domain-containing protein [Methylobacterium frigidaeris]